MKTLYIMRHPQEELSDNNTNDSFDLGLTENGVKQLNLIAQKLKDLKLNPDLIVSSPAIHTRQTAEAIKEHLCYKKNIMYNEVLYQAFLNELVETISYTFDSVNELFIVGHNPSLAMLAYSFVQYKEEIEHSMVLKIEFNCDSWIDIESQNATLACVIKSKS